MYAVFTEVNADESQLEAVRDFLTNVAVPRAREAGAKTGYWLAPQNSRGISVSIYDTEDEARRWAARLAGLKRRSRHDRVNCGVGESTPGWCHAARWA
jgi:hypothetical protein